MQKSTSFWDCRFQLSDKVEKKLEGLFSFWAKQITRLPWLFILIAFLICGVFSVGFVVLELENEAEKVWIPQSSTAYQDSQDVEDDFGEDPHRYLIYVTSANSDNKDLMQVQPLYREPFQALVDFDTIFKTTVKSDIDYSEICERLDKDKPCVMREYALGFWEAADHSINYDAESPYQVHYRIQTGRGVEPLYEDFDPHYIPTSRMFSGRRPKETIFWESGRNNIYYFQAIQYQYTIQRDDPDESDLHDWQENIETLVEDFNDANAFIDIHVFSVDTVSESLYDEMLVDYGLYGGAIAFILLYSIWILGRCHPVYCRTSLFLAMVVSYGMTLSMSLAFPCYVGYKFVDSNYAFSFLILLQTILSCSFLLRSTENVEVRPDEIPNNAQKFSEVVSRACVSLFKVMLIGLLVFGIGSYSSFQALRVFCAVGTCASVFGFFNNITFFAACLYYDFARVMDQESDCCNLCKCDPENACFFGGRCVLDDYSEKKQPYVEALLLKRVLPLLTNNICRLVLLAVYLIICACGIAGAVLIRHEFKADWLVTDDDSQVSDAIDVRDEYFGDRGYYIGFYTTDVDFTFKETQKNLLELEAAIRLCQNCDENWVHEDTLFSWYSSFKAWIGAGRCQSGDVVYSLDADGLIPEANFNLCLNLWKDTSLADFFVNDLIFNSSGDLETARMMVRTYYTNDQDDLIQQMKDLRDIADDYGPGDTFAYGNVFLIASQFQQLYPETWIFITIAVIFTGVVNLATTIRISSSVLAMVNTVVVLMGMLVSMWAFGVEFNVVSVIHLYMIVILGADFSTHITHAFISSQGSRIQRLESAFKFTGATFPHICLSAILALIIFIVPAQTYIFSVFVKCWGLALVLLFICCFLALPAFLSAVGPQSFPDQEEEKVKPNLQKQMDDEFAPEERVFENSQIQPVEVITYGNNEQALPPPAEPQGNEEESKDNAEAPVPQGHSTDSGSFKQNRHQTQSIMD